MTDPEVLGSSFRDPSGFVFRRHGAVYRQVSTGYRKAYDHLVASGLATRLVEDGLMLPFEEVDPGLADREDTYRVIQPTPLPFVSYPYEWCPGQLRHAALLTLAVQRIALDHGMILKDASAYNVQFIGSRPMFIDHLSFDLYEEGAPWVGYRQFCQHFLAPLAVATLVDVRLSQLLRIHLDGIPLDLASRLLPRRTRLRFALLAHVHLHAWSQTRYRQRTVHSGRRRIGLPQLRAIATSLENGLRRLRWRPPETEWGDYYADTNYAPDAFDAKRQLVARFLERARPRGVWDLGGNVGVLSRLASQRGIPTVCFDVDPAAVEANYRQCRKEGDPRLLPLWVDLGNPSPGLGWAHGERDSLVQRGPVDLVMALALIHHLAISQNVPLDRLARFFAAVGTWLVVEFVPKDDSQVQRLLATRRDIFPHYDVPTFEGEFRRHFEIADRQPIPGSRRLLYLMRALNR